MERPQQSSWGAAHDAPFKVQMLVHKNIITYLNASSFHKNRIKGELFSSRVATHATEHSAESQFAQFVAAGFYIADFGMVQLRHKTIADADDAQLFGNANAQFLHALHDAG
jgi:hypothetical protein